MRPLEDEERARGHGTRPRRNRLLDVDHTADAAQGDEGHRHRSTGFLNQVEVHPLHHPIPVNGVQDDLASACGHEQVQLLQPGPAQAFASRSSVQPAAADPVLFDVDRYQDGLRTERLR